MVNCQVIKLTVIFLVFSLFLCIQTKKQKSLVISDINDIKELKKVLRTKMNILILYVNKPKYSATITEIFENAASLLKGQATLISLDCNTMNGKKLCKRMKIPSDDAYYLKHYKDGQFHKDYTRPETITSIVSFLKDPTGEIPWEEDPATIDISHLKDQEALTRFLKKGVGGNKKALVMFYAPWCGYCKVLKPEFLAAAAELRGIASLAALDASKYENSKIRQHYNISGFPTLLYFENSQYKFPYDGELKKTDIVEFVKNPMHQKQKKKKQTDEESWPEDVSDVVHLTVQNFDSSLQNAEHALVVFYAPWCGHCKKIKPEYVRAAIQLKNIGLDGRLMGAIDATREPELAKRYEVKGYPTLKYFSYGIYKYDVSHLRQEEQIVEFMRNPQEPPPPPPPETPWSEEESAVLHLDHETFETTLRKKRHALVMFYAPWCGHCKNAKPEFVRAAEKLSDELFLAFGAVDCTAEQVLCADYGVKGYPTIKYFSFHNKLIKNYTGARQEEDFVSFMRIQMSIQKSLIASDKSIRKSNEEAGFGANVQLAYDNDFERIIDSNNLTFVMFYASWCDQCSKVKLAFSQLAAYIKSNGFLVRVVAIDIDDNPKVTDLAGIQNLPTFKLYASGRIVSDYKGDGSYGDMLNFIKKNRFKDEL